MIAIRWNPGIREEFSDSGGNCSRRVRRAPFTLNDDAPPLIEQRVCPYHLVDPIFSESKHEIHDREGKQDVGIDEYPAHDP